MLILNLIYSIVKLVQVTEYKKRLLSRLQVQTQCNSTNRQNPLIQKITVSLDSVMQLG